MSDNVIQNDGGLSPHFLSRKTALQDVRRIVALALQEYFQEYRNALYDISTEINPMIMQVLMTDVFCKESSPAGNDRYPGRDVGRQVGCVRISSSRAIHAKVMREIEGDSPSRGICVPMLGWDGNAEASASTLVSLRSGVYFSEDSLLRGSGRGCSQWVTLAEDGLLVPKDPVYAPHPSYIPGHTNTPFERNWESSMVTARAFENIQGLENSKEVMEHLSPKITYYFTLTPNWSDIQSCDSKYDYVKHAMEEKVALLVKKYPTHAKEANMVVGTIVECLKPGRSFGVTIEKYPFMERFFKKYALPDYGNKNLYVRKAQFV